MMKVAAQNLIAESSDRPWTMLVILGLMLFAAWTATPWGHASANNVQMLQADVADQGGKIDRVLLLQLAQAIRSVQQQICSVPNGSLRSQLINTLDGLQEDYKSLNDGKPYAVAPCSSA